MSGWRRKYWWNINFINSWNSWLFEKFFSKFQDLILQISKRWENPGIARILELLNSKNSAKSKNSVIPWILRIQGNWRIVFSNFPEFKHFHSPISPIFKNVILRILWIPLIIWIPRILWILQIIWIPWI